MEPGSVEAATPPGVEPGPLPAPGPLGSAESPPLHLPGRHFALALTFLLTGSIGIVAAAPALASGIFLSPRVVAVTHLFTLGWITTSIMGALYQLLPVALGRAVASRRAAGATFWLYASGLPLFVGGLWWGEVDLTAYGAVLFGAGLLLFAANLAWTLARTPRRDMTWWALAAADLFLVVTLVLGWALAGNFRWGWLGGDRLVALGVHLHVALAGWVLLVIVGVGQRLLPMFLLSHGVDERPGRLAVACVTAGLLILVGLHHGPRWAAVWIPAMLVLAGVAAFLLQARAFYRKRRRTELDPGMGLAAAGLVVTGLAATLAPVVFVRGFGAGHLATTYGVLLVLGISVFVAAHYYKIVPFLVWYHRFGPLVGRQKVPLVADLYDARWARAAGVSLVAGTVLVAAGTATATPPAVAVGAAALTFGTLTEGGQMLGVARSRPASASPSQRQEEL